MAKNPYEPPATPEAPNLQQMQCLTQEGRLNLAFAASVARGLSMFCAAAAVYTAYNLVHNLRVITYEFGGWTWLHYLEAVRGLFIPTLAIFSWLLWQLSLSLRELSNSEHSLNHSELDRHIKRGTWVLIGVSLFAAVSVLEIAARYSMISFGKNYPY